jgi:two-component system sensor kinase FixL
MERPVAAPLARHGAADWIALNLAHELNQPLAAITNYVRAGQRLLASGQPADLDRLGTALDAAMTQAQHAGRIVSGLRAFVTRGDTDRGIENLRCLVKRAVTLATPEIEKYAVRVTVSLDPMAAQVIVDRVQIEQVLVNLIRNAAQAMQDSPHRDLRIASRCTGADVEIAVTDTGGGLPEAVRGQIFAPFVTTRRDGMGLGLAICQAIVMAHGGKLSCQSGDRGTSFRFTVPKGAGGMEDDTA